MVKFSKAINKLVQIFDVYGDFFVPYEAKFSCDMKQIFMRYEANYLVRYEANFPYDMTQFLLCDINRIRGAIWREFLVRSDSESDPKRNFHSEVQYSFWSAILNIFDLKRYFQSEAQFSIWSAIFNLKRNFRSEAIMNMKRNFHEYEANFLIPPKKFR